MSDRQPWACLTDYGPSSKTLKLTIPPLQNVYFTPLVMMTIKLTITGWSDLSLDKTYDLKTAVVNN